MADLTEYESDHPVPHTVLLDAEDAERYRDVVKKKTATKDTKAAAPSNK